MADYAADAASGNAGTTLTARTGTTNSDTVPQGAYVVWRNTGAGAHTITLTNNYQTDTGQAPARVINIAAGAVMGGRVGSGWGDANGRVAVAINGTANEITYYVVGV